MIDSRSLEDLLPCARNRAEHFLAKCRELNFPILIYSTYRDFECQNWIYAQGRTRPGKIVTEARGGESVHNYRLAFDFVPLAGKVPLWNNYTQYARLGAIAESVGLEWGGRWKKPVDRPHCQFLGGLTLEDLKAGKLPKE